MSGKPTFYNNSPGSGRARMRDDAHPLGAAQLVERVHLRTAAETALRQFKISNAMWHAVVHSLEGHLAQYCSIMDAEQRDKPRSQDVLETLKKIVDACEADDEPLAKKMLHHVDPVTTAHIVAWVWRFAKDSGESLKPYQLDLQALELDKLRAASRSALINFSGSSSGRPNFRHFQKVFVEQALESCLIHEPSLKEQFLQNRTKAYRLFDAMLDQYEPVSEGRRDDVYRDAFNVLQARHQPSRPQ